MDTNIPPSGIFGALKVGPTPRTFQSWKLMYPLFWPSLSLWGFNDFFQALCSVRVNHEFQVLQLP